MSGVAFVGLGNMGAPMAANLVRSGVPVVGIDADATRAQAWADALHASGDARAAERLADVLAEVDTVVTMLPSGAEVRAVVCDPALAGRWRPGAVVVDMSSAGPAGTRVIGSELAANGVAMVDAPVSGGVPRAVDGTLSIMIGGDPAVVSRVRSLLEVLGERLFPVGALGNGHAMKALNNYVAGSAFAALCEAVDAGERFGLDPEVMIEVMNTSTARSFNTDLVMRQHVVSGRFASGFALGLLAKDVGIARELVRGLDRPAPVLEAVSALLDEARDALGPAVDHTRAYEAWRGRGPVSGG